MLASAIEIEYIAFILFFVSFRSINYILLVSEISLGNGPY